MQTQENFDKHLTFRQIKKLLNLSNNAECMSEEILKKLSVLQNTDEFKCFCKVYSNEKFLKTLKLSTNDLKYLIKLLDGEHELGFFCHSPIIKYVLKEFLLNKEVVDDFNLRIQKYDFYKRSLKDGSITLFDVVEVIPPNMFKKNIMKLNELNRYLYKFDFNKIQKLELAEVLKNNEVALNRLKEIVDNHLESKYDFESLMNRLKKQEKRNLMNI